MVFKHILLSFLNEPKLIFLAHSQMVSSIGMNQK